MRGFRRNIRQKGEGVRDDWVKRNNSRVNEPEVLDQTICPIRFFNSKYRSIERRGGGVEQLLP